MNEADREFLLKEFALVHRTIFWAALMLLVCVPAAVWVIVAVYAKR